MNLKSLELELELFPWWAISSFPFDVPSLVPSFRFRSFICLKCGTDKHSHDNFDVSYLFSRRSCDVRHTWDAIINFQYETMWSWGVGGWCGRRECYTHARSKWVCVECWKETICQNFSFRHFAIDVNAFRIYRIDPSIQPISQLHIRSFGGVCCNWVYVCVGECACVPSAAIVFIVLCKCAMTASYVVRGTYKLQAPAQAHPESSQCVGT